MSSASESIQRIREGLADLFVLNEQQHDTARKILDYAERLQKAALDYLTAEDELETAREALGHARSDGERRERNPRVIVAANAVHQARKTLRAVLHE